MIEIRTSIVNGKNVLIRKKMNRIALKMLEKGKEEFSTFKESRSEGI